MNYTVKIKIASLEEVIQEQQQARQQALASAQQGELPERLRQAIQEGQMTQEQAEEMMRQSQQRQGRGTGEQAMPSSNMIPENFQLREGLTIIVSIIMDERNDVVLVPNTAITTQGRQTYVQVLLSGGTTEQRSITTGISDWQYTEVTSGLSEGEQVVVSQATATASSTSSTSQQRQQQRVFIPGIGGGRLDDSSKRRHKSLSHG